MPLTVECPSCGKSYTFGERFAGRKATCTACGTVMPSPGGALPVLDFSSSEPPPPAAPPISPPPPPPPPLSLPRPSDEWSDAPDLAGIERTGVVLAPVTAEDGEALPPPLPAYVPPLPVPSSKASPPREPMGYTPSQGIRPKEEFFQLEEWIYNKLPLWLIFVGYVCPIIHAYWGGFHLPNPAVYIISLTLAVFLLVGVVAPLTVLGLKLAARVMNFQVEETPGLRLFAAFGASNF